MSNRQHNATNVGGSAEAIPKGSPEISKEIEAARDDGSAKARLMEAATKLFAEHGLEGTSTRDIAKAADLNISLISYYFGGKEGLYKEVLAQFAERMRRETEKVLASLDLQNLNRDSFQSIMRAIITEMLPLKMTHREIHVLLQREMMSGLPFSKDIYENIFSKILKTIVSIYEKGQKKGFVRKEINPYVLFFSLVHASDSFMQMSFNCPIHSDINENLYKLPEQIKEYGEQMYLIFVEGVLV